jgi:hypothetical protein
MRFLERIILGLRYHWKAHMTIAILTVFFTVAGLFLQTNLMLENQAQRMFNTRLSQLSTGNAAGNLPGGSTSTGTTNGPAMGTTMPGKKPVIAKTGITKHIANIYQSQSTFYQMAFWVLVVLFAIAIIIITVRLERRNRNETRALMLVGKRSGTIAFQSGLESLISFGGTFAIVTLFSLLLTSPIIKWLQSLNRFIFLKVVIGTVGKSETAVESSLASIFHNHFTDFTSRSLLVGHDFGTKNMVASLSGYSIIFLFGAVLVVLIPFTATLISARKVRKTL